MNAESEENMIPMVPLAPSRPTAHLRSSEHRERGDGTPRPSIPATSTNQDQQHMHSLGRTQVFARSFGRLSSVGFASLFTATWEYTIISLSSDLTVVGFPETPFTFLIAGFCFFSVILSLAEMQSMTATACGMYAWTSEFGSPSSRKFLSYLSGWLSSLGWIANVTSGAYVAMHLVQSLVKAAAGSEQILTPLQSTAVVSGYLCIAFKLNGWSSTTLPRIQTIGLMLHVFGFFSCSVMLIVTDTIRLESADENSTVETHGGWHNLGLAFLLSLVNVINCTWGPSSIAHMSEEIPNARKFVPRCMIWSYAVNLATGVVMLLAAGNVDSTSEFLYELLLLRTGKGPACAILSLLILLIFFSGVTELAAASRLVWAFSRDRGFPGSDIIHEVDESTNLPIRAINLAGMLACALLFVPAIGGVFALEMIISLGLLCLLSTFMIAIISLIYARATQPRLPKAYWSLGRFGILVNLIAVLTCTSAIFFTCFPAYRGVSIAATNWAPFAWVGFMLYVTVMYFVHGRHYYKSPF